ncbi:sigma-70 family RNA polymerase sigma factor [Brachybacterium vulturis]|uniref:sigma-70 family RNA polymerase sigma factor n=1 Tax=Brachybacterium vulturis TaxID=2017484 RepID=UPI0037350FDF
MTTNPPHDPAGAGRRKEQRAQQLQQERPRLIALATRVLGDPVEAQDIIQQAWLRLDAAEQDIESLPAWLTTVTTRLCLDRLRRRTPVPEAEIEVAETAPDPAEDVELADTVGIALQLVLDRLSPNQRVAFVMHDSFGFEFTTIAAALDTTPEAARKLASRARAKIAQSRPEDALADWEVVDAFMTAAREGDFRRLLELLAPDAVVRADAQAIEAGTPAALDGREEVASFFNGAAKAALPVGIDGRAASAWFHRGTAKVLFDLTVVEGRVTRIDFRADPEVMERVVRRDGPRQR